MSKCDVCPVRGPECVGLAVRRVCDLIASGDLDYRDEAIRRSGEGDPPKRSNPARERVNLCLYRECNSGCQKSKCYALRRGERFHDWEPFTEVTLTQCLDCMSETSAHEEPPAESS